MTLLSCKIIYTVAEQGSFLRAASLLNLTPSAISHAIRTAENELGFQIFNRNKSGVNLTSYGEQLFPYVAELLNSEENLNQFVDKLKGLDHGTVKIGAFNSVCIEWLPDLLTTFRERHPAIDIEVFEGTYDDVIGWLYQGVIEIGFLSASCNTSIPMTLLCEDRLVCIAPKGFVTKTKGYITLEEMQHHPFVVQRESCDADIQKFLSDKKLDIHRACHVIDDQSTAAMVASGFGISIMPELTSRSLNGSLDILEIEETNVRLIGLATPEKRNLSPAANQLRELILEKYKKINEKQER